MFVNCPFCRALVATDPATDLPPERCPRCAAHIRDSARAQTVVGDARSDVANAIAAIVHDHDAVDADLATQPAVSIATLLQPGPESALAREPALPPVPECQGRAFADIEPPADADGGPATDVVVPEVAYGPAVVEVAEVAEAAEAAGAPAAEAAEAITPPAAATVTHRAPGRVAPSFARRRTTIASERASGRRWLMPAAIAGLTLLLALQWLLADRARLAADPGWRPLVAGACAVLQCSLPTWREPSAFVLLERDVRPHPEATDALRITASFRNDAAWPQSWPDVVLTLSDIDGRPLGTRAFSAAEYLGGPPPSDLLDSGQGAVIRMDVLEPGTGAVGFAFDFH